MFDIIRDAYFSGTMTNAIKFLWEYVLPGSTCELGNGEFIICDFKDCCNLTKIKNEYITRNKRECFTKSEISRFKILKCPLRFTHKLWGHSNRCMDHICGRVFRIKDDIKKYICMFEKEECQKYAAEHKANH